MNPASDFQTIATHAGIVDRSNRVRVEISGPDRAKLLQNLTTNEVKGLAVGRGCEAFVTSTEGTTLGYVILLVAADRILVRSDPGGMELALPHFRKYGVFDDVTIQDVSAGTFEFHLLGAEAENHLRRALGQLPARGEYRHSHVLLEGQPVHVVCEAPAGLYGFSVIGAKPAAASLWSMLLARGRGARLIEIDAETYEVLRIAAGTPVFGKDITEKNLPQEIGHDERAISFVKGCYLGQETVARLDALGQVRQVLRGLLFMPGSACPPPGSSLWHIEQQVGVITSSAFSPVRNAPLALGMVRTVVARRGTVLAVHLPGQSETIAATVTVKIIDASLTTAG
jgi:tRNA-modifying protein YgfZ